MHEPTIVSTLGFPLLFWWARCGRNKVDSIAHDVSTIKRLYIQWTQREVSPKVESTIYKSLSSFVADSQNVLCRVRDEFQDITPSLLVNFIETTLPDIAERVSQFDAVVRRAECAILTGGSFLDGPYEVKSQREIDEIFDIIDTVYRTIQKSSDMGVEILRQLKLPEDKLAKLTHRLDVLLNE